jgi:calcium binding protein 39
LDFESRKHVAAIYNYLLVCGLDGSDAGLYKPIMNRFRDYVESSYDKILTPIVQGHDCSIGTTMDVALHCGTMYRSSLRHLSLYQQLVTSTGRVQRYVFPFLDTFVHCPSFDAASDAMESLKLVLTGGSENDQEAHQAMAELASEFLTRDYVAIFDERFNPKLLSADKSNYMTRRMALQILSTVLLTRSNYNVMIQYIASKSNLMMIMLLLRDPSPHISLDAFHVFKIFVANPNKPPEIIKILSDNKVKLCKYLESLHKDREAADSQFRDEKALVISTLEAI